MATVDEWPDILEVLVAGEDLSQEQAARAMGAIMSGEPTPSQIAAFLVALRMKGPCHAEMCGLLSAMLDAAEPIPIDGAGLIDTCGTGGSPQRRVAAFNVSTGAAVVAAAGGARVCKHGNRRATATSGSADVLETVGAVINLGGAGVAACIEQSGLGFCFAPRYHPGMRHAGPVRRELRVRTVFNFLGPLANPARPKGQVVGVSDPTMAGELARVLQANGATRAMVVFGHDGLDELTTTSTSTVYELRDGEVNRFTLDPRELGIARAGRGDLEGGDAATNAAAVRAVLNGEPGPVRDIALLNAAAALVVAGRADKIGDALELARAAVDSGAGARVLEDWLRVAGEAYTAEEG